MSPKSSGPQAASSDSMVLMLDIIEKCLAFMIGVKGQLAELSSRDDA
jgi:hypothetical protein